jgi:hypothetical protein
VSDVEWMSLVMSAFLGVLALTVVVATFYVMRSWSAWLGRTRVRRAPGGGHRGAGHCLAAGTGLELGGSRVV